MENLENLKRLIRQSQDKFLAASLRKDASYVKDYLHEEFVFTSPRAVLMNKQSFINDFVSNVDVHLEVFEIIEENTSIIDKTAVSTGIIKAKFKGKELFNVRMTTVLININDNWLMLAFQETIIP